MRIRTKLLKGGVALIIGIGGQQLFSVVRNIVLARLLAPHDFGTAVTLAIMISVVEMMSDVGVEKFLISSHDGDRLPIQGSLHAFLIVRGIALGAAIFLLADPVAKLFGVPDAAWAYRWLSIVPIVKGFAHLDAYRFQRDLIFWPNISVNLAGAGAGLASAVIFAFYLRNFEAMLWAQLVEAVVAVIVSHWVAQRRYLVSFVASDIARLFVYGWPLIVNGGILFAADQGDRILVGAVLGTANLAIYTTAGVITFGPSLFILRVTGSLFLPLLSAARSEPEKLVQQHELTLTLGAAASICLSVPLIFFGDRIVTMLFGLSYEAPRHLDQLLAIAAGAIVLRSSLIASALASGNTKAIMFANCFKFVGLGLAVAAVNKGYGALGVAMSVAVGQVLTTTYFFCTRAPCSTVRRHHLQTLFGFFAVCGASICVSFFLNDGTPTSRRLIFVGLLLCWAVHFSLYLHLMLDTG